MGASDLHTLARAEEFVGHQGSVNCVKIGRKSSGVLVTGGEDKKVNLWTIGTQTRTLVSCKSRQLLLFPYSTV